MAGTEVKILKICLSASVKLPFWSLSCIFFVRHLCLLFRYQVSCFRACLHLVQYSPRSQVTENLFSEFPG